MQTLQCKCNLSLQFEMAKSVTRQLVQDLCSFAEFFGVGWKGSSFPVKKIIMVTYSSSSALSFCTSCKKKREMHEKRKLNEYTGECRPPSRPNSPPTSRKFRGSSKITVFNTRCHECSQQFVWLFGHTFAVCPDSGSKRKIMGLPASIAFFI